MAVNSVVMLKALQRLRLAMRQTKQAIQIHMQDVVMGDAELRQALMPFYQKYADGVQAALQDVKSAIQSTNPTNAEKNAFVAQTLDAAKVSDDD